MTMPHALAQIDRLRAELDLALEQLRAARQRIAELEAEQARLQWQAQ